MTLTTRTKNLSLSAVSIHDENLSNVSGTIPPPLTERGHSDSVVPSCRLSPDKQEQVLSHASPSLTTQLHRSTKATEDIESPTISSRLKNKQDLRLPPFQSLGITSQTSGPTALLTPPEEPPNPLPIGNVTSHPRDQIFFSHFNMPKTPADGLDPDSASGQQRESSTLQQSAITITTPHGHQSTVPPQSTPVPPEPQTATSQTNFVSEAVDLAVSTVVDNTPRPVYNVLCHSQPCPFANGGSPTTAFSELLTSLQSRIPSQTYIEITHAVPPQFNMGQVPNSPAATPNPEQNAPVDYFSMPSTFSKAVVAASYQDVQAFPVPSSPHPIVAPTTVQISLLERFIPPSSTYEYHDLFSTDTTSALVDRLTELSPSRGTLLFIYPTKAGARKFNSDYLAPLLHPLLRNLVGIYDLASDFGRNIAEWNSISPMLEYDRMNQKLGLLLRQLGRIRSSKPSHPPPKYEIAFSAAKKVDLDRDSWMAWYIVQEKARIQRIVKNYWVRGQRIPEGMTEGGICRELFQGLERRDYSPQAPQRDGVEVGVWVVRRTA
ncbi:uncharacterized protein KY384_007166 [Bacidia gigantensis]|uniref:uncharacterized protein n=1 Tax=Bacidia gigantensis TaxID=2732470 RepID=UPI001D04CC6D|nr:uncharacterized protein KY384_007166 [Bacidia gigantensis]KAG8528249.1 hypothetical protein KY384_007166 [Bacidia gigantensis]